MQGNNKGEEDFASTPVSTLDDLAQVGVYSEALVPLPQECPRARDIRGVAGWCSMKAIWSFCSIHLFEYWRN